MRTLVAVAVVLLAACSKAPDPALQPAPPPEPSPAPPPRETRVDLEDLRIVLGEVFEVRPKADKTTGHDLIVFVGRRGDLEALTEAHLSKDGPKNLRALRSKDDLHLFLLWGPRIDVLAKGDLKVDRIKNRIRVDAQWKYSPFGGMPAPAQILYVGYGVRIGRLRARQYEIVVEENSRIPEEGMRRSAAITFEVLEGSGPPEPEPPPEAGKELPRLTCQSGCCVGMHTFNFGAKCGECKKVDVANGHKFCSTCAQKLRKCVHCGQEWK